MLKVKNSSLLSEEAQTICFSYGEALTLQYLVFALSNHTLKILVESRADGATSTETLPWFQYHRICCMCFTKNSFYLHILTCEGFYMIVPIYVLFESKYRPRWNKLVSTMDPMRYLDEERGSGSHFFELINPANLLSKIFRKGSASGKPHPDDANALPDEASPVTLKEVIFYQIAFSQLLNFENYSNVVHFGGGQGLERLSRELSEVYKSYSHFVFWKNSLEEEFCIIATLGGGLFFMKISNGKQALLYKFPFGIQEMTLVDGKNYSYLLLISDLGEVLQFHLQLDKKSFRSILDCFESKEFRPYFLKFGHGAKLFFPLSSSVTKRRIFVYKENAGELLMFKKKSLEKPEKAFSIKLRNVLRISNFYDYLLVLSHQKEFRLSLISKNVLSFKEKLRQEQENSKKQPAPQSTLEGRPQAQVKEGKFQKFLNIFAMKKEAPNARPELQEKRLGSLKNASDFSLDGLKNAERFCQTPFGKDRANLLLDLLGPFFWNPERTNNKLMDKAIFASKKYLLSNCLMVTDRGVSYIGVDIEAGHTLFLEKIGSEDFKKEDFLCYEIFLKTHFTSHKKILKELRMHLRNEKKFSALFYLDMYRKFSSVERKQALLDSYIALKDDPSVHSSIISYLLTSEFALKKKHLTASALQIVYIMHSPFLKVPYSAFQSMVACYLLPSTQVLNEIVAAIETNEYTISDSKLIVDPALYSSDKRSLRIYQLILMIKLIQHFVDLLFMKLAQANRFTKYNQQSLWDHCVCDYNAELPFAMVRQLHSLQRGFSLGRLAVEFKNWGGRFLCPADQIFLYCLTDSFAANFETPSVTDISIACMSIREPSAVVRTLRLFLEKFKLAYSDYSWFNSRSAHHILDSFCVIKAEERHLQVLTKFLVNNYAAQQTPKKQSQPSNEGECAEFLQKKTLRQLEKIVLKKRRAHELGVKTLLFLNLSLTNFFLPQRPSLATGMTELLEAAQKIADLSDVVFYSCSLGVFETIPFFATMH